MLTKIRIKLKSDKPIKYQMSSLLHGALMEQIDPGYADYLHRSQLHPYSTHMECIEKEWYWVVSVTTGDARRFIIDDVLLYVHSVKLIKKDMEVCFVEKHLTEVDEEELITQFYRGVYSKYINVQVLTPLAFKHDGCYVFYPDVRMIYQSLMNKLSIVSGEEMFDVDTLENLATNTKIIKYDIKSTKFSLEGITIPGFIGSLTFRVDGPQTMINFANVLFRVGEFAGIGIKNSIGMGAVKIQEEREKDDR